MGGDIQAEPGARIGGTSVSYPNASPSLLTFIEGPSLGLSAASPPVDLPCRKPLYFYGLPVLPGPVRGVPQLGLPESRL